MKVTQQASATSGDEIVKVQVNAFSFDLLAQTNGIRDRTAAHVRHYSMAEAEQESG